MASVMASVVLAGTHMVPPPRFRGGSASQVPSHKAYADIKRWTKRGFPTVNNLRGMGSTSADNILFLKGEALGPWRPRLNGKVDHSRFLSSVTVQSPL